MNNQMMDHHLRRFVTFMIGFLILWTIFSTKFDVFKEKPLSLGLKHIYEEIYKDTFFPLFFG